MHDVTLRPLTSGDQPLLREFLLLAIHVPPGDAPPEPEVIDRPDLARYVAGWMRPGDRGVVAEGPDGEPVGVAWLRLWRDGDRGYGFVDEETPELSMAVRADARGLGIGTRLVRRLLREAGDVSLSVSRTNPARRLYEREGFVPAAASGDSLTMVHRRARES